MSTIISIHSLELWTRIGVPNLERAIPQRILANIRVEGAWGVAGATDDLSDTVDYESVYRKVKMLAQGERKTLEKFGEDITAEILKEKKVQRVTVELRKFILPGTREVSLSLTRP